MRLSGCTVETGWRAAVGTNLLYQVAALAGSGTSAEKCFSLELFR